MKYNIIENTNKNLFKFNNKIIIFNFDEYYNFLLKGYYNKKEIETQFLLDIERSYIKYNNFIIKDINRFNEFLKNKYNYNLLKKLYIISSQTLFSYIYKLFVDILPEEYYLCEIDSKKIKNNINKIKIIYNNINSLNISIYKCMRIFKFDENEIDKDIIYILFYYNIDLENDKFIQCSIKYYNTLNELNKNFKI